MISNLINKLKSVKLRYDDQKKIAKLCAENRKLWKQLGSFNEIGDRAIISEPSIDTTIWGLSLAFAASVIAAAYRAKVIYLLDQPLNWDKNHTIVQKSYSNCIYYCIDDLVADQLDSLKKKAEEIFESLERPEEILEIKYEGVILGPSIYDSIIKHKQVSVWSLNEKVYSKILEGLKSFEATKKLTKLYDVRAGMFAHKTTSFQGPAVRYLLSKSIMSYSNMGGTKALIRYNKLNHPDHHLKYHLYLPPEKLSKIIKRKGHENLLPIATKYINDRMEGNLNLADWNLSAPFSSEKKSYKASSEFCKNYSLDPQKPCVFIMLHGMVDDPHIFDLKFFKDFYDWFVFTLQTAVKNDSVNWIFKQHPIVKFYPDEIALEEIFTFFDYPYIKYLSEEETVNSAVIPKIAHAIITGGGTSGLEFSCLGIPSIVTFDNQFTGHGICHEPKTKDDYARMLMDVHNLKCLDQATQEKARLLFYLMYDKLFTGLVKGFFEFLSFGQMRQVSSRETIHILLEKYKSGSMEELIQEISKMKEFIKSDQSSEEVEVYLNYK